MRKESQIFQAEGWLTPKIAGGADSRSTTETIENSKCRTFRLILWLAILLEVKVPKGEVPMEERNDEWGKGCVIDGRRCFDCGDCMDDEPRDDFDLAPEDFMIQRNIG